MPRRALRSNCSTRRSYLLARQFPLWRRGLEAALTAEPDNLVPYQLFRKAGETIQEVATDRLKLFNRL